MIVLWNFNNITMNFTSTADQNSKKRWKEKKIVHLNLTNNNIKCDDSKSFLTVAAPLNGFSSSTVHILYWCSFEGKKGERRSALHNYYNFFLKKTSFFASEALKDLEVKSWKINVTYLLIKESMTTRNILLIVVRERYSTMLLCNASKSDCLALDSNDIYAHTYTHLHTCEFKNNLIKISLSFLLQDLHKVVIKLNSSCMERKSIA